MPELVLNGLSHFKMNRKQNGRCAVIESPSFLGFPNLSKFRTLRDSGVRDRDAREKNLSLSKKGFVGNGVYTPNRFIVAAKGLSI